VEPPIWLSPLCEVPVRGRFGGESEDAAAYTNRARAHHVLGWGCERSPWLGGGIAVAPGTPLCHRNPRPAARCFGHLCQSPGPPPPSPHYASSSGVARFLTHFSRLIRKVSVSLCVSSFEFF
jgi:hypothetical protein